jgi:hypothetical protein
MNPSFLVTRGLVLAAFVAVPVLCRAADSLETVAKSADEWVKLRVETTRLQTAWEQERTFVQSMVTALTERAASAEEQRDLVKARTAREREELETLRAKIEAEGNDLRAFETRLKNLTTKLVALRPSLPPRLSDALEMAFRSFENKALPVGERMQLAMSVLNRCAQFNRTVTYGEEVLALESGSPAKSLEVIYWGLSHGYAVDRTARKVWLGSPSNSGWKWEPKSEAFENVARLIAVANDKADPEFVNVPATVPRSVPANPAN